MSLMDLSSVHVVPVVNNCCSFYRGFGSRSKLQNIVVLVAAHGNTSSVLPGEGAGVGRGVWGWEETVPLLLLIGNQEKIVWEAGTTAALIWSVSLPPFPYQQLQQAWIFVAHM